MTKVTQQTLIGKHFNNQCWGIGKFRGAKWNFLENVQWTTFEHKLDNKMIRVEAYTGTDKHHSQLIPDWTVEEIVITPAKCQILY